MTYVVLLAGAALVAIGLVALLVDRGRASDAVVQVLVVGAVLVAAAAVSTRQALTTDVESLLVLGTAFTGVLALIRRPEAAEAPDAEDSR